MWQVKSKIYYEKFADYTLWHCWPVCWHVATTRATGYFPIGRSEVIFSLTADKQPSYRVYFKDSPVIETSTLGFDFKDAPSLSKGMRVDSVLSNEFNETWELPWGEQRLVKNHYNEMKVFLSEKKSPNRHFAVTYRVYDDGIGFRYEFPQQESMGDVTITDENTQFKLTGDHLCWWEPGDWDIYEHLYNTTSFSKIDATKKRNHRDLAQTSFRKTP